jgi:hypothetical protein
LSQSAPDFFIVDDAYPPDRLYVERLGDIDVQPRPVTGGAHEVARQMRKTGGELEQVLRSALGV